MGKNKIYNKNNLISKKKEKNNPLNFKKVFIFH